jgi:hypothetical protein
MRLTSVPRVLVPSAVCAAVLFAATGPAAALTSIQESPDATAVEQRVTTVQGVAGVPPLTSAAAAATDRAAADATDDASADLQEAIDELVAAVTAGTSPTAAMDGLLATVTGMVNSILGSVPGAPPVTLPVTPTDPAILPVTPLDPVTLPATPAS